MMAALLTAGADEAVKNWKGYAMPCHAMPASHCVAFGVRCSAVRQR
jgi:hypothetical protein